MFSPFKTYDHYEIDKKQVEQSIAILKECCVCYEIKDGDNNVCIKLRQQKYFVQTCLCDVDIHPFCLEKWYMMHNSCPICRVRMETSKSGISSYRFVQEYSYYMQRNLSRIIGRFCAFYFFVLLVLNINNVAENIKTFLHVTREEQLLFINNDVNYIRRKLQLESDIYNKLFCYCIMILYCFLQYMIFLKERRRI